MAYAREPERLYPQTTLAAHVIGYTDFDGRGVMGMERVLNDPFSDPLTRGKPVALSIDKRVQAAMESELSAAMMDLQAVGATGLVLDVNTGEIIAMVSLPVFNPNRSGEADPEAMRNNVTQSVYRLGSTFKMLTMANAIDTGVVTDLGRRVDATAPIEVGRFKISDDHLSAGSMCRAIQPTHRISQRRASQTNSVRKGRKPFFASWDSILPLMLSSGSEAAPYGHKVGGV